MTDPRVLDRLLTDLAPTLHKRGPFWHPGSPAIAKEVRLPVYGWSRPIPSGTARVKLDANGAYISAASTVRVAHGALEHTGLRTFTKAPGYWLVDTTDLQWGHIGQMPSPLGTGQLGTRAWLASPTVALLLEQVRDDYLPEFAILDSWTCPDVCQLDTWTSWIRDYRAALIATDDREALAELKISYAQAVQMMLSGKGSVIHRPDWRAAIVAQHAATTWRKAWKAARMGIMPVAMSDVDAITYTYDDYLALAGISPSPLRMDQSGASFGTFKVSGWFPAAGDTA